MFSNHSKVLQRVPYGALFDIISKLCMFDNEKNIAYFIKQFYMKNCISRKFLKSDRKINLL